MSKQEIIIIRESVVQSIVKDVFTIGGLIAAVALGKWIDSNALQWIGAIMLFLSAASISVSAANKNKMTLAEAKARIDAMIEAAE